MTTTTTPKRNSHCHFCGAAYAADVWPRHCAACEQTTYRNPTPVAVLLLPVDDGVLCIRRGLIDGRGQLALPGGYVDFGETWQQAAARELLEETQIRIDADDIKLLDVHSAPNTLLVFATHPRLSSSSLSAFSPSDEITERVVVTVPTVLAFDLHTRVLGRWFGVRETMPPT